jgi:hypothetical protein
MAKRSKSYSLIITLLIVGWLVLLILQPKIAILIALGTVILFVLGMIAFVFYFIVFFLRPLLKVVKKEPQASNEETRGSDDTQY